MSSKKRSKALKRVIKLLNLATSDENHEADLALNHAHSVIYNHNIQREEIEVERLCDANILAQVDWYGDWTERPEPKEPWELEDELEETLNAPVYQPYVIREKNTWQEKQQARNPEAPDTADTIVVMAEHTEHEENTAAPVAEYTSELTLEPIHDASEADEDISTETSPEADPNALPPSFDEIVESGAFMVFEREPSPLVTTAANDDDIDVAQTARSDEDSEPEAETEGEGEGEADTETETDTAPLDTPPQTQALTVTEFQPDAPDEHTPACTDAIDSVESTDFDEGDARIRLAQVINRIIDAKNYYTACRDEREQGDIDEEDEKAIRIQAEIEAEEAAERAFRERAEAQLKWEAQMRELRQTRRHREQSALKQLRSLRDEHEDLKKQLAAHESWKAEQARLALLDEIANQLQVAADHIAAPENPALDTALQLMDENALKLEDLPLTRIHHKSIFMQLLEREAHTLDSAHEREKFTQKLLSEYLAAYHPPTVDLAGKVLELLKVASSGSESAEDAFRDAQEILAKNSMSIRDLDIGQIDQISLFVRLLNWEADKLLDMDAREHFTAKMLDKYFEETAKV